MEVELDIDCTEHKHSVLALYLLLWLYWKYQETDCLLKIIMNLYFVLGDRAQVHANDELLVTYS